MGLIQDVEKACWVTLPALQMVRYVIRPSIVLKQLFYFQFNKMVELGENNYYFIAFSFVAIARWLGAF